MTALDGVALVEGENGGNHWCAEEEEEEEQKDPQRGLLSGARAETAGQAHWDLYLPPPLTNVSKEAMFVPH